MRPLPWGEAEEDWAACWRPLNLLGGPSWTRTTDLTLIRGALSPPELRAHTIKENSTESIVGPPDRVNHEAGRGKRRLLRPSGPRNDSRLDRGGGGSASDWRRAVAAVSERRVAEGRALYTERSPAELYRGPGAASASVTLGLGVPGNLLWRISGVSRRADSERSGPPPAPAVSVITK